MATYSVYRPTVTRSFAAASALSDRPPTLEGKRIGMLWNAKTNADVYLQRLQERLHEQYDAAEFVWHTKQKASEPISPEGMVELAKCDVVLTAYGDCGSCSSWTIHDAVTFEQEKIPTVAVVSEPFAFKSRAEASALGVPTLPIQVIPHPLAVRSMDHVRALADRGFDEIVFALTGQGDMVGDAYTDAVEMRSRFSKD
jgi:hypothetical protein